MKSNVALVGFMGTGKSAVGRALAARLGHTFVEMDRVIQGMAGKPIPAIFGQDGEIAFREMEIEAARRAAAGSDQVIACGGGVVLNKINIDRLRQTSHIVHLAASPQAILRRTSAEPGQRPLLDVPDPAARIRELVRLRRPFYELAADFTVNTSRLSIAGVVNRIIAEMEMADGAD